MRLGILSDSLGDLPFTAMLDQAERMGVAGVEVNTGGWSRAPHCDLTALLASAEARRAFRAEFTARGLDILALNACGNPLHPVDRAQGDQLVDTIRLAGELDVRRVCTTSGLPAGSPSDSVPNWIVTAWPPETQEILQYQWDEVLLPFWMGMTALAREAWVGQLALSLHGNQCVYNAPGLLRLREEAGPTLGAALDPSQLFWTGADPYTTASQLREALFLVHARDAMINDRALATNSMLETADVEDVAARAWNHVTVGVGHGAGWWRQFFHHLRMAGYDGWVSVHHQDAMLSAVEGLDKSLGMLRQVMPVSPSEYQPQAI